MVWSEDGSTVTLTAAEYHHQVTQIGRSHNLYLAQLKRANELDALLANLSNKDELLKRNAHLVKVTRLYEAKLSAILGEVEGLMRETYHTIGNVSRTNRTALEENMAALKPQLKDGQ